MEIKVDSKDMMYPTGLAAGQTLPDASITISAGSGGVNLMNMVVNITNRKVAGNESVTVPAGTFDCFKITYDVETKFMFKISSTVTEYVSYGVGNVKTETYDKKGKLMGTSLLTEISK
jgi:ribosomal protein L11